MLRPKKLAGMTAISVLAAASLVGYATSASAVAVGKAASTPGPIKIGFIDTESGPEAIYAESHIVGARFAAAEINKAGGILGRKIQIVLEDDQWTPSLGVAGLRTVAGEGVHLVIAGSDTDVCNAEIPLLKQLNVIMMSAGCSTDSQTGVKGNSNWFRVNSTTGDLSLAIANYICKAFPRRDASMLSSITT
jgi:branched-chain amino acid transport system substrate-binding protein